MSSQTGNMKKKAQKYQNTSGFKNNMHDTSRHTKELNVMVHGGLCARCEEQIKWKIKYKKYKPLTQPKKCTKCNERTVTKAYHTQCKACASSGECCAKCGKAQDQLTEHGLSPAEEASRASQMEAELKHLSERQRRTVLRSQAKGNQSVVMQMIEKEMRYTSKLEELGEDEEQNGDES